MNRTEPGVGVAMEEAVLGPEIQDERLQAGQSWVLEGERGRA